MQKSIGRKLRTEEHVHHKDGDHTNNDINNLEVISASDHGRLHKPPIYTEEERRRKKETYNKAYRAKYAYKWRKGGVYYNG